MAKTNTQRGGPKTGRPRKTKLDVDQTYKQHAAQAEKELDAAFKKLMKGMGTKNNDQATLEHLDHLQELLESATGGKAFILHPAHPVPPEIVQRVLGEQPPQLRASEALYAFAGWLTTRDKPIIMSAKHNASAVADAVNEFVVFQGLPPVRDGWEKAVVSMRDHATHITNDPAFADCQVAAPPPSRQDVVEATLSMLRSFSEQGQNAILAEVLEFMKDRRSEQADDLTDDIAALEVKRTQLQKADQELNHILHGSYSLL